MERCQKQYLLQHEVSGQQVSMIAVNKSDVASYNDYMNNRRRNSDKQAEMDAMKEELETLKLMLKELASKITS